MQRIITLYTNNSLRADLPGLKPRGTLKTTLTTVQAYKFIHNMTDIGKMRNDTDWWNVRSAPTAYVLLP